MWWFSPFLFHVQHGCFTWSTHVMLLLGSSCWKSVSLWHLPHLKNTNKLKISPKAQSWIGIPHSCRGTVSHHWLYFMDQFVASIFFFGSVNVFTFVLETLEENDRVFWVVRCGQMCCQLNGSHLLLLRLRSVQVYSTVDTKSIWMGVLMFQVDIIQCQTSCTNPQNSPIDCQFTTFSALTVLVSFNAFSSLDTKVRKKMLDAPHYISESYRKWYWPVLFAEVFLYCNLVLLCQDLDLIHQRWFNAIKLLTKIWSFQWFNGPGRKKTHHDQATCFKWRSS